jgi:hypothetical protein
VTLDATGEVQAGNDVVVTAGVAMSSGAKVRDPEEESDNTGEDARRAEVTNT